MVAIGGADRALTVWDASTGEIRYKVSLACFGAKGTKLITRVQLPGHTGTVIATDWSPREPVIASGGVEGVIYLGEVEAR